MNSVWYSFASNLSSVGVPISPRFPLCFARDLSVNLQIGRKNGETDTVVYSSSDTDPEKQRTFLRERDNYKDN